MVGNYMTRDVQPLGPEDTVMHAAERLLQCAVTSLPVVDGEGKLVGVISEADILRLTLPHYAQLIGDLSFLPPDADFVSPDQLSALSEKKVGEVMHRKPLYVVEEQTPLAEAAILMLQHRLGQLPVVHEGKLVGVVTRRDILEAMIEVTCKRQDEQS